MTRVGYGLFLIFTANYMLSQWQDRELAKTNYTKAIDVYTGMSVTFLFVAVCGA